MKPHGSNLNKPDYKYSPAPVLYNKVFFITGATDSTLQKMNTPPRPTRPTSILHGLFIMKLFLLCRRTTVAPPPPLASRCHLQPLPPHTSSASTAAHLLIVVFCCCYQRCCCPSATNHSCLSVAPSAVSYQPPLSSTSSYPCC